jgi:hypothetical protein
MNKRGRFVLLTVAMSGMAAAALSVARRRRASSLTETTVRPQPFQGFEDVVLAMDVIEDAERPGAEATEPSDASAPEIEGRPEPSHDSALAHEFEATAQPNTTIPPEQQPGGGPPHR